MGGGDRPQRLIRALGIETGSPTVDLPSRGHPTALPPIVGGLLLTCDYQRKERLLPPPVTQHQKHGDLTPLTELLHPVRTLLGSCGVASLFPDGNGVCAAVLLLYSSSVLRRQCCCFILVPCFGVCATKRDARRSSCCRSIVEASWRANSMSEREMARERWCGWSWDRCENSL